MHARFLVHEHGHARCLYRNHEAGQGGRCCWMDTHRLNVTHLPPCHDFRTPQDSDGEDLVPRL
eukprot:scaffold34763_cov82-Phaeocystis_antarctica.AAC.1